MPRTGTPSVNTAFGATGACNSVVDSGPPERMTPLAPKARTSSSLMSHGWISQYTPLSRTRRAISCVYCAPKSRIRIRWAWMSGGCNVVAEAAGRLAISADTVVRRLFGDRHVVYVAFAHARVGDSHERRPRAHLFDRAAAGIAHRGAQTARELMQDLDERALVRHAPFDAFRHELLELLGRVLEVAILRAVRLCHRTERAHAAIRLVRRTLVQLDFAGRLLRTGKKAADHHAMRASDERLGDVAGETNAAICNQWHA